MKKDSPPKIIFPTKGGRGGQKNKQKRDIHFILIYISPSPLRFFCIDAGRSCPEYIYFLTHGGHRGVGCDSKHHHHHHSIRQSSPGYCPDWIIHICDQTWPWSSVLTMAIGSQWWKGTRSRSGPTIGGKLNFAKLYKFLSAARCLVLHVVTVVRWLYSLSSSIWNCNHCHQSNIFPLHHHFSPCDKTDDTISLEHVRLALYAISTVALVPAIVIFHIYRSSSRI